MEVVKTICRFFNNADADLARSLLVSIGIEAVLAEDNANTLGPGFAPGGVRLQVPDQDTARALEILDGRDADFAPLPDDFVPPQEVPGGEDAVPQRVEGFGMLRELVPAGLCVVAAMVTVYALYIFLSPLNWTHNSAELIRMGTDAGDKKDFAKAVKCFDAALILNPRSYQACYDRGLAFFYQKDYGKAIEGFTAAINLNSRTPRVYVERGLAYKRLGRYDKALEDFKKAIDLDPKNYNAYIDRGLVYSEMGDDEKAIEDYKLSMKLAPVRSVAYNNLAWVYATSPKAEVRNGAKALELAMKACQLSEWKRWNHLGTLAAAEAETGKFDDAIKHQQDALALAKAEEVADGKMLIQMADALTEYQQKRPYRDSKK